MTVIEGREGSVREKSIEQRLVREVARRGGVCPKCVSPGFAGMPDRLVFLPGGCFGMVEVKAPGRKAGPLQAFRHRQLRGLGARVYVIDGAEEIGGVLDDIQASRVSGDGD